MWKCQCGHCNSDTVRWCENCDAKHPNEAQRVQAVKQAEEQKRRAEEHWKEQKRQTEEQQRLEALRKERQAAELAAAEKARQQRLLEEEERKRQEQANTDAFLKANGHEGFYEYQVLSISDSNSGSVDIYDLAERLNALGRDGWRLVSSYANELGHNTTPGTAFTAGSNATIDQNILIFERFIKFK